MDTKPISEFPGYYISEGGVVFTERQGTLRVARPSRTQRGSVKVTLYKDCRPYTKSLALLVARAWVWNDHDPDLFNTPIHLDNDPTNNHASNLVWRPRWFATKYARQYWATEYRHSTTRVMDVKTGEEYGLMEVCQKYGFLYIHVLNSCTTGEKVFPSFKIYTFA